jgi:hypothetical protein
MTKNLCDTLENENEYYHFRIHKDTDYIFFEDLDKWEKDIYEFIELLKIFLLEHYNLKLDKRNFKYTQNDKNN